MPLLKPSGQAHTNLPPEVQLEILNLVPICHSKDAAAPPVGKTLLAIALTCRAFHDAVASDLIRQKVVDCFRGSPVKSLSKDPAIRQQVEGAAVLNISHTNLASLEFGLKKWMQSGCLKELRIDGFPADATDTKNGYKSDLSFWRNSLRQYARGLTSVTFINFHTTHLSQHVLDMVYLPGLEHLKLQDLRFVYNSNRCPYHTSHTSAQPSALISFYLTSTPRLVMGDIPSAHRSQSMRHVFSCLPSTLLQLTFVSDALEGPNELADRSAWEKLTAVEVVEVNTFPCVLP